MRYAPSSVSLDMFSGRSVELIYADGLTTISRTAAVIDGMTYPIREVSSVRVTVKRRMLGFIVASAICGVSGILAIRHDADVAAVWLLVLCVTLSMVGYANRPLYVLLLRTPGGEAAAFTSMSADYVERLRSSIETAIVEQRRTLAARRRRLLSKRSIRL